MATGPLGDSLWRATRPSLLDRARDAPPGRERNAAWSELVEYYRRPIGVCVRRHVGRHPDADAIVDEFFSYLFTSEVLARRDRTQGPFRAFLQGVIRNYVRVKIRGYAPTGDAAGLEHLLLVEPPSGAEVEEERTWARSLLDRAVEGLRQARPRDGRILASFYGLYPERLTDTEAIAQRHGLSLDAVYKALERARTKLRRLIEEQIVHLVDSELDFETEKQVLIGRLLEAQPDLFG